MCGIGVSLLIHLIWETALGQEEDSWALSQTCLISGTELGNQHLKIKVSNGFLNVHSHSRITALGKGRILTSKFSCLVLMFPCMIFHCISVCVKGTAPSVPTLDGLSTLAQHTETGREARISCERACVYEAGQPVGARSHHLIALLLSTACN